MSKISEWNGYTVNNTKEVIDALKANGGKYVDDHRKGEVEVKIQHLLIVERKQLGFEYAAPGFDCAYFSVNPLYVGEDGKAHLSTRSIGGAVAPMNHNGSLEKAIQSYNEEHDLEKAESRICFEIREKITQCIACAC